MVHNIQPHAYHNEFVKRPAAEGDSLLIFQNDRILLHIEDNQITFPVLGEFPGISVENCRHLFSVDETEYSMLCGRGPEAPAGFSYYTPREYRAFRPLHKLFPLAVGGSLNRWYTDNRFCGRCGAENHDSEIERALVCPSCGRIAYPKICPAVIVAVRNGEKILLTKYANRPGSNSYALIAGFNEIGESIEETVHREVWEEVGLRVKNLQFYKSQPWVFTDTLLMGFYCDLDGDDTVCLQDGELERGWWVDRKDLPEDPSNISLTGEMVAQFRLGLDQ